MISKQREIFIQNKKKIFQKKKIECRITARGRENQISQKKKDGGKKKKQKSFFSHLSFYWCFSNPNKKKKSYHHFVSAPKHMHFSLQTAKFVWVEKEENKKAYPVQDPCRGSLFLMSAPFIRGPSPRTAASATPPTTSPPRVTGGVDFAAPPAPPRVPHRFESAAWWYAHRSRWDLVPLPSFYCWRYMWWWWCALLLLLFPCPPT